MNEKNEIKPEITINLPDGRTLKSTNYYYDGLDFVAIDSNGIYFKFTNAYVSKITSPENEHIIQEEIVFISTVCDEEE